MRYIHLKLHHRYTTVVRVSKTADGVLPEMTAESKAAEYLIKTDEKMEFTFTFKGI